MRSEPVSLVVVLGVGGGQYSSFKLPAGKLLYLAMSRAFHSEDVFDTQTFERGSSVLSCFSFGASGPPLFYLLTEANWLYVLILVSVHSLPNSARF